MLSTKYSDDSTLQTLSLNMTFRNAMMMMVLLFYEEFYWELAQENN